MTVLVTGAAGFIGYHLSEALVARGERVVGLDNLNAYYDVRLKEARLARLQRHKAVPLREARHRRARGGRRSCSPGPTRSTASSISPPRPACAIR